MPETMVELPLYATTISVIYHLLKIKLKCTCRTYFGKEMLSDLLYKENNDLYMHIFYNFYIIYLLQDSYMCL